MKKKLVAGIFAIMLLVALPTMAFAAGSATQSTKSVNGVTASGVANFSGMTVSGPTSGLGTYEVNGITDINGSITITFNIGTEYAGQSVYILCTHNDGTTESWTKTVGTDGMVSVTVSQLSTFDISLASGASAGSTNTSSTSPRTGVDLNAAGIIAIATAVCAGGLFVATRKQDQQ